MHTRGVVHAGFETDNVMMSLGDLDVLEKLVNIFKGCDYMHTCGVVHTDLKYVRVSKSLTIYIPAACAVPAIVPTRS